MTDEEYKKEVVRCFDIFGQALYLTIRAATATHSPTGALDASRAQWMNLGKKIIQIANDE